MTLFGQLPNKRWRCWVEIDDLITSMNELIAEADDQGNNNGDKKESSERDKQYTSSPTKDDILNRGYPLIGSIPSSLVEELENITSTTNDQNDGGIEDNFVDITPPTSPTLDVEFNAPKDDESAVPYSSHSRRSTRKTLSQLSFDTFFFNGETSPKTPTSPSSSSRGKPQQKRSGSISNLHSPLFYQKENAYETGKDASMPVVNAYGSSSKLSSLGPSISLPLSAEDSPASSANNSPIMPVKLREGGFIIKKRLRQKGISIIVGSSSSEGLLSQFSTFSTK